MRIFTGFVAAALLATPLISSAATTADLQAQIQALLQQIAALQAQLGTSGTGTVTPVSTPVVTTTTTDSSACPLIGRILSIGSQGDDVTRLQQFLARDRAVYPEGQVTGFYGSLTAAAVGRWQAKYNIISSGTAATTGFGQVGPRTAAAMSLQCTTGSTTTTGGGGLYATGSGVAGGFIQVSPISGNAPLNVKVTATVNTAGSCSGGVYTLSWGDGSIAQTITVPSGQCGTAVQNYAHQYIYGGTYIITLSAGSHSTSATIVVSGAGAPATGGSSSGTSVKETFNANPTSGTAPLQVTFTGTVTGSDPNWCSSGCSDTLDFGDGTTAGVVPLPTSQSGSQSYSLAHTYQFGGTYTATLFQGAKGASNKVGSVSITVAQGAYAPFALSPNVGGNPLAVSVNFDLGGCPAFTLNWGDGTSFGGGGPTPCTSATPTYSHVYSAGGSYTITLTRGAQTDTASLTISN